MLAYFLFQLVSTTMPCLAFMLSFLASSMKTFINYLKPITQNFPNIFRSDQNLVMAKICESRMAGFENISLNDIYFVMSSIEESGSLVIAQGKNQLDLNSIEQNNQKQQDLFELSRDDPTLSFQIEEEKKQPFYIQIRQEIIIESSQQPQGSEPKRKRKDIFDKFKKSTINHHIKEQDNLLNIFDSIFKTKNQSQASSAQPNSNLLRPLPQAVERSKTPSAEKRQRLKIFGKKSVRKDFEGVLPSQLIESQVEVYEAIKPDLVGSPILHKKGSDSINLSLIQNRLSRISAEENLDFSREEQEIQNILQSQIFKAEQSIKEKSISPIQSKLNIESEETIIKLSEICSEKKQVQLGQLPKLVQNNGPVIIPTNSFIIKSEIQQSRVVKNDYSIMSNAISMQQYQQCSNGGFKAENSMANFNNPNISDFSTHIVKKQPSEQQIYQSRIIQSVTTIVKTNIFQAEKRIPIFLRDIRKHISIYPNFYAINNANISSFIKDEFNELFKLFTQALQISSKLCDRVLNMKSKKKLYLSQLSNSLTLQFFLDSKWQAVNKKQFESIKPLEPFQPRQWSYQKAKAALNNYQTIVEYYRNKDIKLSVESDKGKRKYFQIRQKFWDICGNMKLISQDIYTQMLDCQFPEHFEIFHAFLKDHSPIQLNDQKVNYIKSLSNLYRSLRSQNDLIINSPIGTKIKAKLDYYTKYMFPY